MEVAAESKVVSILGFPLASSLSRWVAKVKGRNVVGSVSLGISLVIISTLLTNIGGHFTRKEAVAQILFRASTCAGC